MYQAYPVHCTIDCCHIHLCHISINFSVRLLTERSYQMQELLLIHRKCQDMPANECQQLYSNLVTAVIRVGQADEALSLLKDPVTH